MRGWSGTAQTPSGKLSGQQAGCRRTGILSPLFSLLWFNHRGLQESNSDIIIESHSVLHMFNIQGVVPEATACNLACVEGSRRLAQESNMQLQKDTQRES